jgi:hypothetical protein
MKHKSPDYKLSAVNYYLNHDVGLFIQIIYPEAIIYQVV